MTVFVFQENDDRAKLANITCKLIWQKHNGDIKRVIPEVHDFYDLALSNIRNIHELIESEIPLLMLFRLYKEGAQNLDLTANEYETAILDTTRFCVLFYEQD